MRLRVSMPPGCVACRTTFMERQFRPIDIMVRPSITGATLLPV
jgi:hypothetical protein